MHEDLWEGGEDRRQMVRMRDRVLFSYFLVPPEKLKILKQDFEKSIPLYHQEGIQDIRQYLHAQRALDRLRQKDQDLADFLHHLDSKINLLLSGIRGGSSPLDKLELQEVSLSGGGISFYGQEKLAKGDVLELHMILQPGHTFVYSLGEVIDCRSADDSSPRPFRISAKFEQLMDEDHDKIMQHLFKLQSIALRHRRLREHEDLETS